MGLLGEVVQDISKVETNLGCRNHRLQRRLNPRHNLVRYTGSSRVGGVTCDEVKLYLILTSRKNLPVWSLMLLYLKKPCPLLVLTSDL